MVTVGSISSEYLAFRFFMSFSRFSISFGSLSFGRLVLFNRYWILISAVDISVLILVFSFSNSTGVKICLVGETTQSLSCVLDLRKKFGILCITYIYVVRVGMFTKCKALFRGLKRRAYFED